MNAKAGEHRRSEICGLDVTISARYDWSVASFHYVIGISGILPYSRNVTLQTFLSSTRDFYRLHSTFARLYNAAASPASRLRSAGSLAIIIRRRTMISMLWKNKIGVQVDHTVSTKVKNDHRSKFSNLSNWKEEA